MKKQLVFLSLAALIALSACGNNAPKETPATPADPHAGHSTSGEIPKGLKPAANPTYKVGSQAILQTDHMPGMKGATATIVGAYDTVVYAVSYTPTTGGQPVKNHKWVIQEDLKDAGTQAYKPGDKVTLNVEHMPGMKGAVATIDSAEETTIYMVDYTPTTGGAPVKNHQWVTANELSAK